jgi:hypothetical protein
MRYIEEIVILRKDFYIVLVSLLLSVALFSIALVIA